MSPQQGKRPRRVPFTPEEVANIIAAKKRRELITLTQFKKSATFKWLNIFNVTCFFIYWQVLICFFGPANYYRHYYRQMEPHYGSRINSLGKPVIESIIFYCINGKSYELMLNSDEVLPPRKGSVLIGRDFLLQKSLKGKYSGNENSYRLFTSSPVLIMVLLTLVTSTVGYIYNLNQNAASLSAISVLNALTLFAVICI